VEDSPAGAGIPVGDSRVEAGSRGVAEDSRVGLGSPVVEDSPVEEGTPRVVEDSLVAADIPVEGDSRAEAGTRRVAVDSRVEADTLVEVGIPAAVAGNPVVAVYRRRSYRTWRKRCCPGRRGSGNWGRLSAAACRMRYSISGRGRY